MGRRPRTGSATAIDATGGDGAFTIRADLSALLDALNFVLFVVGLGCTLGVVPYPLVCVGLTVASVAVTVAAVLTGPINTGTPFGAFSTVAGASVSLKRAPPFGAGNVGVALVVILLFLISLETFD